jgi:hypothetical protein
MHKKKTIDKHHHHPIIDLGFSPEKKYALSKNAFNKAIKPSHKLWLDLEFSP